MILIILLGLGLIISDIRKIVKQIDFTNEFRNKFVELSNEYFEGHNTFPKSSKVNNDLHHWLTKNSIQMQGELGIFGIIEYVAPFQTYRIKHYEVIINTLPKYRDGNVSQFDVHTCDDTLLRFIGVLEKQLQESKKQMKNPFIWVQRGFQTILSLPIFLLKSFGIISDNSFNKITRSLFYKIMTGIAGLIAFLSCIVTIIQGREATIQFIQQLLGRNTSH